MTGATQAEAGQGGSRPDPPDQTDWDTAATAALIGQLDAVRANADKWAATMTALLGVLSAATIVAGVDTLADLSAPLIRWLVAILTLVAGLLSAVSVIQSARAAQGTYDKETANVTGDSYRAHVTLWTGKSVGWLRTARWSGFAAAALVFVIGAIGLGAALGADEIAETKVLVVGADGVLRCGRLATDSAGTVTVNGQSASEVSDVQVVERC